VLLYPHLIHERAGRSHGMLEDYGSKILGLLVWWGGGSEAPANHGAAMQCRQLPPLGSSTYTMPPSLVEVTNFLELGL
jgi:hypothetical protein